MSYRPGRTEKLIIHRWYMMQRRISSRFPYAVLAGAFIFIFGCSNAYNLLDQAGIDYDKPGETGIWLEAENFTLEAPFDIYSDEVTASGNYIENRGTSSIDEVPHTGIISRTFNVPNAGTYTVFGRTIATEGSSDSLWVRMNGGPWIKWNGIPESTGWSWNSVHDFDRANAVSRYYLSAGENTLYIACREKNVKLDKIYITNRGDIPSGTGGTEPGDTAGPGSPGDSAGGDGTVPVTKVWLEAEDFTLEAPLGVYSDSATASGSYIENQTAPSTGVIPETGIVSRSFEVSTAGVYKVFGRTIAKAGSADSFWVRMNDGPWIKWNGIPESADWSWNPVWDFDKADEVSNFSLVKGMNTLFIAYRERNVKLDKIYVTGEGDYPDGKGN